MAISLQELRSTLFKQAAMGPAKPDAGSQAMMMAAQAARPAGAPPLPKPIDVEDGAADNPDMDKMLKEKDSELEKAKKENEKLRHDLNKADLAHQQEMMMRDIEKKEKESLDKIKAEMEILKNEKTLHQAEGVQHKAKLEKETAMAQVKLEQQKSKALIDYNKQQVQEQIKRTDEARKESDRYKDEARAEAERMKDEARSYVDQYRTEVQKQLDTERSDMRKNLDTERATMQKSLDAERTSFEKSKQAISPALDSLMDNALKSLKSIPVPNGAPIMMKESFFIQDNDQISILSHFNEHDKEYAPHGYNTSFDSLIKGASVKVPQPDGALLIKAANPAEEEDSFFDFDGFIADFASKHPDTIYIKQKLEGGLAEQIAKAKGLDPKSPGALSLAQSVIRELGQSAGGQKILHDIVKGHLSGNMQPAIDNAVQTIATSLVSGDVNNTRKYWTTADAMTPENLSKKFLDARQQGANFNLYTFQTPDKIKALPPDWMISGGKMFLPHITSEMANSEVGNALYQGSSSGFSLRDENNPAVLGFGRNNWEVSNFGAQTPILSHGDQVNMLPLWDTLSIDHQQQLGNIMHPVFRNAVGWNPLNSEGYRNKNTEYVNNAYKQQQQVYTDRAKSGLDNGMTTNTSFSSYGMSYNPYKPVYASNRWDASTGGMYSMVGAFAPMAKGILGQMPFPIARGIASFIPGKLPGLVGVNRQTRASYDWQDHASEVTRGAYKDNNMSSMPGMRNMTEGARSYYGMSKNNMSSYSGGSTRI